MGIYGNIWEFMGNIVYTRKSVNVLWRGQTISYRSIRGQFQKDRSLLETVSAVTPPPRQCLPFNSLQGIVIFKSTFSIGFQVSKSLATVSHLST